MLTGGGWTHRAYLPWRSNEWNLRLTTRSPSAARACWPSCWDCGLSSTNRGPAIGGGLSKLRLGARALRISQLPSISIFLHRTIMQGLGRQRKLGVGRSVFAVFMLKVNWVRGAAPDWLAPMSNHDGNITSGLVALASPAEGLFQEVGAIVEVPV